MPSIVFPAPGCETGQQFVTPFVGFDLTATGGGLFVNLLKNSFDLSKSNWLRGGNGIQTGLNYNIVDWYVNEGDYLSFSDAYVVADGFGGNIFVSSTSSAFIGQSITVTTNTTYTASFYAKRGTAQDLSYAIYDQTNSQFIDPGTSYFSLTTTTAYTRIITTFVTSATTTGIIFYPIYNTGTNSTGSVFLSSPQVQLGATATTYDATKDISFAALGVSSVVKTSYKSSTLSTFVDPARDFDAIGTIGQNKVKWNIVRDYIFDDPTLSFTSDAGNTQLYYTPTSLNNRPYNIGDAVTIASGSYRQNFTVTSFTTSSITISTSTGVPRSGVQILNPNPSLYPSAYEVLNLVSYLNKVTPVTKARENYVLSLRSPNYRGVNNNIQSITQAIQKTIEGKIRNIAKPILPGNQLSHARGVGKLKFANKVISPIVAQQVISTSTNIGRVTNYITTTNWLSARLPPLYFWPSGLYRLSTQYQSALQIGPDPYLQVLGTEIAESTSTLDLFLYRLESFDDQGVYVGRQVGVVGTDIVQEYDFVNEYIYDYNFTSSVLINDVFHPIPGNPQEFPGSVWLNYNPAVSGSIEKNYFPINSYVRIVNTSTGFDQVTQVTDVTPNSVYVTLNPNFPIFASGTTIQDASPFYYPKEQIASTLSNVVLPIENVATPRENLFYSEYRPRIPGRYVTLNPHVVGENQAVNLTDYTNKLELYYETNLPGDFRTNVVGQNNDFLYNTAVWYANENDLITGTSITNVVKLIFFQTQDAVTFKSGSQVRVRNSNISYDRVFTVLTGTNYSITILNPGDFPIGSITTVEQTSTSVYPRAFVKPITRPTNARENLYYFELAPGYRRNTGYAFEPVTDNRAVNKLTAVSRVKLPASLARTGKVAAVNKLKSLTTLLTVPKVTQAAKVKQPNIIRLGRLETVKWKSNRHTVFYTPISGITRNISVLKFREQRFVTGNLAGKSIVALRGISQFPVTTSTFSTRVESYLDQRTVRPILQPLTPAERFYYFNLAPGFKNNSTISYGRTFALPRATDLLSGKIRSVTVLKADRIRLPVEKLKVISPVRGDRVQIRTGIIEPMKFRAGTNQVFFTPRSNDLVKQLFKLRDLTTEISKLSSGKLRDITKLKDAVKVPTAEKLKTISPLKGDSIRLIPLAQLQPMKFRASTAQIFYTPLSADLTKKLFVLRSAEQNVRNANLQKQLFRLVDLKTSVSRLDSGKLKSVTNLKDDRAVLRIGKLSTLDRLKTDRTSVNIGIIQPVKFRADRNQLFFTPTSSNLIKQLFKLNEFNSNRTSFKVGKLRDISSLKTITAPLTSADLTRRLFKLSGDVPLGDIGKFKVVIKAADVIDKIIEFGDIVEKYKILTGLTNIIFVGNTRPIFKANTNQVFERPKLFEFIDKQKTPSSLTQVLSLQDNLGKLRAAIVVKDAIDKKDRGIVKAVNRVKSVPRQAETGKVKLKVGITDLSNVRLPGTLTKQILKIKSVDRNIDVTVLTKRLFIIKGFNTQSQPLQGIIQPIKFRSNTTEVFFAPSFGKTKLLVKLLDQSNTLNKTTTLTKQLFRLKSLDYYKAGKVKAVNTVKGIISVRQQGQLNKQISILKPAYEIRPTITDKVANIFKYKFSSIWSHVFWIDNDFGQLNKQLIQLKSDGQRSLVGKLRSVTKVVFDRNVFVTGKTTQKINKNQVQLFFAPREGITRSASILKGYTPLFTTGLSKLKIKGFEQTNTLKNVFLINRPTFTAKLVVFKAAQGNIEQYRQNKEDAKNPIFQLPANVGLVRSINKLKTVDKRSVAKLSAVTKLKDPHKTRAVAALKAVNKLKQATSNQVVINDINSYFDQLNYTALTPNSPAEWLFYFYMAPGLRYNKGIQQGATPAPITYQAKVEKLSTFDNQGLISEPRASVVSSTDPIVNIVGRTEQFTNDVVLFYIFDRDVLTVLPVNSPTVTLYFSPMENISTPFVAGQTIRIYNPNNQYSLDTTVLSATNDSVTITQPGDFPSISGMTVRRVGTNYPVRIYYLNTGHKPLYPVGEYVQITDSFARVSKIVQVTDAGSNFIEFLKGDNTIQLTAFQSALLASASVYVYPRTSVNTTIAPQNARENLYYAELAKGFRGVFLGRSRFAAALPVDTGVFSLQKPVSALKTIRLETIGNVVKLIAGDYKKGSAGISDVAAPKKEPIQFWN